MRSVLRSCTGHSGTTASAFSVRIGMKIAMPITSTFTASVGLVNPKSRMIAGMNAAIREPATAKPSRQLMMSVRSL